MYETVRFYGFFSVCVKGNPSAVSNYLDSDERNGIEQGGVITQRDQRECRCARGSLRLLSAGRSTANPVQRGTPVHPCTSYNSRAAYDPGISTAGERLLLFFEVFSPFFLASNIFLELARSPYDACQIPRSSKSSSTLE